MPARKLESLGENGSFGEARKGYMRWENGDQGVAEPVCFYSSRTASYSHPNFLMSKCAHSPASSTAQTLRKINIMLPTHVRRAHAVNTVARSIASHKSIICSRPQIP